GQEPLWPGGFPLLPPPLAGGAVHLRIADTCAGYERPASAQKPVFLPHSAGGAVRPHILDTCAGYGGSGLAQRLPLPPGAAAPASELLDPPPGPPPAHTGLLDG